MFSFFRLNDPYRLIFVFVLLFIIHLPVLLNGNFTTKQEYYWMEIGEKMAETNTTLYVDISTSIAPLAAVTYWLIHVLFGGSIIAYKLIALFLIGIQAAFFNNFLLSVKAYNENTYIPALIYVVLASCFFDFISLSPILISLTFILLAIHNTFIHIENRRSRDGHILNIGHFLSLASLFYLPSFIFLLPILTTLLLFTSTNIRKFLLLLYGFGIPFMVCLAIFFWMDGGKQFNSSYLSSIFKLSHEHYINSKGIFLISLFPLFFFINALITIFRSNRFNNYQIRLQQAILFIFLFASVVWVMDNKSIPHHLLVFLIPIAFFVSHYFMLIRRTLKAEVLFLIFFAGIVVIYYGIYFNFFASQEMIGLDALLGKG